MVRPCKPSLIYYNILRENNEGLRKVKCLNILSEDTLAMFKDRIGMAVKIKSLSLNIGCGEVLGVRGPFGPKVPWVPL